MKRRIVSILMMVTMAATLLVGCGGSGNDGSDEKVRIVVPDRVLTEQGADAFTKQKQEQFDELYGDEIEVVHILPYESADVNSVQNLTAVLMGNDAPAYVSVSSTIYMKDLYNMGLVADITSLVKENEEFQKIRENVIASCTYSDGKIIAYPTMIEVPLLGFHNEALENAGYAPETFACETWDDYYEIAEKMTTSEQKGASLYLSEFFLWPQNWILSNGADVAVQNDDGTISLNYTDEKVIEAVAFMRKLYQEGLTNENAGSVDLNGIFTMMYNKDIASFTMYPSWIDRFVDQGIDPEDITLSMFPKGTSGESQAAMYVAGNVFNAKLSEAELEAALKYVTFMNSEETQNEKYQYFADNGISDLDISCMENVDWTVALTDYPQQWLDVIEEAIAVAKDNDLNATGYSTYIAAKLPAIVEGNGDIAKAMKEAEDLTKEEWLNDYNSNLKK